jgi:uncharacterized membrane protein YqgA involved in biofilm formation
MTILGSIQDGLGNPNTLFIKALLDGSISIFFASTLGVGVAFAAIPIIVFQGGIALLAAIFGDMISALTVSGIEAVGGALIVGIGLNLTLDKKIRVGNMLPCILVIGMIVTILS